MLAEGTLVWAKQRTHPPWPAVVAPTASGQTHKGKAKKAQTHVIFLEYGMQHAWVLNKNITEFTLDNYEKNRSKAVKTAVGAAIDMLDTDIADRLAALDEGYEANADIQIEEEMDGNHDDNVYAIFNGMKNATADKGDKVNIEAAEVVEEAENIDTAVEVMGEAELETDSHKAVDGDIEAAVKVVEEAENIEAAGEVMEETDSPNVVDGGRKRKRGNGVNVREGNSGQEVEHGGDGNLNEEQEIVTEGKRKCNNGIKLVVNPLYGRRNETVQEGFTRPRLHDVGNQENAIQDSSSLSATEDRPSSQNDRQASTSSQSVRSSSPVIDQSSSCQNVGQGEASYQNSGQHNATSQSLLQDSSSSEKKVKISFEMSEPMWSETLKFGRKILKAFARSNNNITDQ